MRTGLPGSNEESARYQMTLSMSPSLLPTANWGFLPSLSGKYRDICHFLNLIESSHRERSIFIICMYLADVLM